LILSQDQTLMLNSSAAPIRRPLAWKARAPSTRRSAT